MRPSPSILLLICVACGGATGPQVDLASLFPVGTADSLDASVVETIERRVALVNADPGHAETRRSLALALEANSFWTHAIEQFRITLELDPSDRDSRRHLAGCLRQAGELEAELLELERVVDEDPSHTPALNQLGIAYLDRGDLDAAERTFQSLRGLLPEHPHGPLGLGQVMLERGDAQAALPLLQEAQAKGKGSPFVEYVLGECLAELGRESEAEILLTRGADADRIQIGDALEAEKSRYAVSRAGRLQYAATLHDAGDTAGAHGILSKLEQLYPDDVVVLNNLAAAQLRLKRYEEALATLEKVITLEPDQYAAWFNIASIHFDRALALQQAGKPIDQELLRLGLRAADKAVEHGDHLASMHTMRAKVLFLMQALPEAILEFQRAIDLGSDNEDVFLNCAKIQFGLGLRADGFETLFTAATRHPEWAEVRVQLFPLWLEKRDGINARSLIEELRGLIPGDPRLTTMETLLQRSGL